jgi:hypothetical protein
MKDNNLSAFSVKKRGVLNSTMKCIQITYTLRVFSRLMSLKRYYMSTFVPYYTVSEERKRQKYISKSGAMRYKFAQSTTKSSMR